VVGLRDLLGRTAFAALFQTHVVVGAHAREECDFLPAQAGNPAAAELRHSCVFWAQELAPRPRKLAKGIVATSGLVVHDVEARPVELRRYALRLGAVHPHNPQELTYPFGSRTRLEDR
jgi:hypothetical protein